LPSAQKRHSVKMALPSANARPSVKVNGRQLLTAADGSLPSATFAECLALGKEVFAECFSVPRVLHSVNELVTKSRTLPSAALGKGFFADCPTKSTRQRLEFW
jgi:hypothetical protein